MKQYRKGDVAEFDHQAAIEIIRLGGGKEVVNEPVFEALPEFNPQKPERVYVSKPKKVKHADAQ